MKKLSLLMFAFMLLCIGNVKAQDEVEVLIQDDFSAYTVGNKLATEATAAGNNWWTTWSEKPGTAEDGVVAEYDGDKCAHLTYGNDQVLLLGGTSSGVYDLEFDILIPQGKNGYFNILHDFNEGNSVWALESHLHMLDYETPSSGQGAIQAGGLDATFTCVYDEWMHFRLHVDTDADLASYYYTLPGQAEEKVLEWKWSLNTQGGAASRKLDAMDFFPPLNAATSEYYLDNFKCTRIGGETIAELSFDQQSLSAEVEKNDVTSLELSFENIGTSIAEYTAWVDYGEGVGGSDENIVSYATEELDNTTSLGWNASQPVTFEIAALYPGTSYANSVMGTRLEQAAYFLAEFIDNNTNESVPMLEPGTDMTFRVYAQGFDGVPGEILAEKTIPAEDIVLDWNVVAFDEPVYLTGFDFYLAVEMTQCVNGYPMVADGNDSGVLKGFGDLYRQDKGAFRSLTEDSQQNIGNFHIMAYCVGKPSVGGWASIDKTNGSLAIGASETITVDFSAIGLEADKKYEANIAFLTNTEAGLIKIPVSLNVKPENVEEILSNLYNIYPNPTTGLVTVEAENINYISVYNSVGQLVKVVASNNTVDMSAYENGVYFFNVVDNAGVTSVQRIVVAK